VPLISIVLRSESLNEGSGSLRIILTICLCILLAGSLNAANTPGEVTTVKLKPNVVRWATASEKDNFGYDVFRGSFEEGPFEQVNSETIPGGGTTDIPQRYEFTDSSIQPDTVYWYYVESISLNGDRNRMTPIYPSKPKRAIQP
jgi:hypothetical protein